MQGLAVPWPLADGIEAGLLEKINDGVLLMNLPSV